MLRVTMKPKRKTKNLKQKQRNFYPKLKNYENHYDLFICGCLPLTPNSMSTDNLSSEEELRLACTHCEGIGSWYGVGKTVYMLNGTAIDKDVGKKFWLRLQEEPRCTRTSIVNAALRFYFNSKH